MVKAWDYAIFSPTRDGFLNDSIAPSGWIDVFLIPHHQIEVIKHLLK
ncbi:MAG: hypothetical protein HC908_10400 [Calothrix sp. SM1_7_51]|nr:hypothetical protein [Calothrix sp. SM1_7_51]